MIELFCVASGPSLIKSDCDIVAASGSKILAVNNSWQMFERCDYIYAGDYKWWREYWSEINIQGDLWTSSKQAAREYGLNHHLANGPFNSGMRAIHWAIGQGFKTIGLLGYDCSLKHGSHWHGDHDLVGSKALTQQKLNKWKLQFAKVEKQAAKAGAWVVNFSRDTDLACFPVADLEDILNVG